MSRTFRVPRRYVALRMGQEVLQDVLPAERVAAIRSEVEFILLDTVKLIIKEHGGFQPRGRRV